MKETGIDTFNTEQVQDKTTLVFDEIGRRFKRNILPFAIIASLPFASVEAKSGSASTRNTSPKLEDVKSGYENENQNVSSEELDTYIKWIKENKPDNSKENKTRNFEVNIPPDSFRVDAETLKSGLMTLPKEFLDAVSEIVYVDKTEKMPATYSSPDGMVAARYSPLTKQITFFKSDVQTQDPEYVINELIIHELSHGNDFENSRLPLEDRIELLKLVTERINSPGRFKSAYVERLIKRGEDVAGVTKVREYFAEILATYLSNKYDKLPDADRDLVKDFLTKMDKDFNREESLKRRNEIIKGFKAKERAKILKDLKERRGDASVNQ